MPDGIADDDVKITGEAPDEAQRLQAENADLRDRLLRALADAENTRRRAERSAREARQYAIADFARDLLAVTDNLRRAIEAAEREGADAAHLEGVRATERILMATLERFGVRRIAALGQPFDPALHEAMMEVEDDAHAPSTVVRVLEEGYTLNDRLLRPARVAVAKRRSERPSPQGN